MEKSMHLFLQTGSKKKHTNNPNVGKITNRVSGWSECLATLRPLDRAFFGMLLPLKEWTGGTNLNDLQELTIRWVSLAKTPPTVSRKVLVIRILLRLSCLIPLWFQMICWRVLPMFQPIVSLWSRNKKKMYGTNQKTKTRMNNLKLVTNQYKNSRDPYHYVRSLNWNSLITGDDPWAENWNIGILLETNWLHPSTLFDCCLRVSARILPIHNHVLCSETKRSFDLTSNWESVAFGKPPRETNRDKVP